LDGRGGNPQADRPGRADQLLVIRLAGRAIVSVQNPIVLTEDTEPQPDLAIRRRRAVSYKDREAHAEDVVLLIEVADTSLRYDRSTKLRLYAATGVPELAGRLCRREHRGLPQPRRRGLS
jgi:hypothetical protein